MKFWRRHKHELNRTEEDEPLPQPPEKKMRYSRGDDILLAKYFFTKPEGTSDKIFQAFGRIVSHHCSVLYQVGSPGLFYSIPIILGRDGRNTTVYTKPRLITLFSSWEMARTLTLMTMGRNFESLAFTINVL